MKIAFHGAAQTVTGSKHLITMANGKKILLDCGMYQGLGKDTMPLNNDFGFNPAEVNYLVLSHAHVDHCGLIPKLVKDGFSGPIYTTAATKDLAEILLKDSAYIQANDVKFLNKRRALEGRPPLEPLYTIDHVVEAMKLFQIVPYEKPVEIADDITLRLFENGHILGAVSIFLELKENGKKTTISFSGDVGRYGDYILKSPSTFPQADYIIIESTYGDRLHERAEENPNTLRDIILHTCMDKKGKLIIPSFSVGRTQELLFALNDMELDYRLPPVKYYVDSPLSTAATNVVKSHPECFNRAVQRILKYDSDPFDFRGLQYIEDKRASQALNSSREPCVIISASGMAEAGRVKHHIANNIEDPRTTILMVGYCERNSLGARLKRHPEEVTIFGQPYKVCAEIETIDSMSAHADYNDLCQYLACQDACEVKKVFVVHGEETSQIAFKDRLIKKGFLDVVIPKLHEEVGL